jgi:hypothetical protein
LAKRNGFWPAGKNPKLLQNPLGSKKWKTILLYYKTEPFRFGSKVSRKGISRAEGSVRSKRICAVQPGARNSLEPNWGMLFDKKKMNLEE